MDELDGWCVFLRGRDHKERVRLRLVNGIDIVGQFAALVQIIAGTHDEAALRVVLQIGALGIIEHGVAVGEKRRRHVHRHTTNRLFVPPRARGERACNS